MIFHTYSTSVEEKKDLKLPDEKRHFSFRQEGIINILGREGSLKTSDILNPLKTPIAVRTLRDDLFDLKKMTIITTKVAAHSTSWFLLKNRLK